MLDSCKLVAFAPTTDFGIARKFYEQVLGLRFISQDPFALVMECNGTVVRLTQVEDLRPQPFTILGWTVPDIQESVAKLSERGVVFEDFGLPAQDSRGIWTSPTGAKVAWFMDPDRNVLSITEQSET